MDGTELVLCVSVVTWCKLPWPPSAGDCKVVVPWEFGTIHTRIKTCLFVVRFVVVLHWDIAYRLPSLGVKQAELLQSKLNKSRSSCDLKRFVLLVELQE